MPVRRWISDDMWARVEPYLPDRSPQRGGRWSDHREVIEAIAWKYRTGSPWRDLPDELGSWKGAYSRFRRWTLDGTWQKVLTAVQADADAAGELDWLAVAVDSTVVRAHQHAAGLRPGKDHDGTSRPTIASAGPVAA
ncbi:IS5 family transposase [Krasilnikovia sp. MM14-A1259]|uniref:IS5 family transposase n=1 Tax=Krasilnikovia sp. MM14-A1259 TaxID=3373539 RepID=UPI00399CDDFF